MKRIFTKMKKTTSIDRPHLMVGEDFYYDFGSGFIHIIMLVYLPTLTYTIL